MITLNATPRTAVGKAARRAASEAGTMPAVVYGHKQEALSISLSLHEFERVLRKAGESTLIELTGLDKPIQVLIHDVDHDPVTTTPRHADFYAIEKGAKVQVAIQLSYVGESPAVKAGSNLVKVMHEIEVEADPTKLPQEIEVDVSVLAEDGDQIHVKDLKLPAGVMFTAGEDEVVALIQAVEIEPEEPVTVDMDAIEVEKKGKEEEEEAEG